VVIAETSYIGRLGVEALAAMALVFPTVILTMTMSGGAMGGAVASAIARALGGGDRERAGTLAAHALLIGITFGLVFMLGMLIIVCVGHTGYILVPGFGPYRAMPEMFQHELPSGLWMDLVWSTVRSGGAMKDIFPSLHTAGPCFIAMFSFRNRDRLPFRYTWPLITFFAANIIGATMFLRWHYIIDVVAGLSLATSAVVIAVHVVRRDASRRTSGLMPSWPMFSSDRRQEPAPNSTSTASAHLTN
jgi:hypothetical protein